MSNQVFMWPVADYELHCQVISIKTTQWSTVL